MSGDDPLEREKWEAEEDAEGAEGMFDGLDIPDGATEDETERDGFLSYAGEWHALLSGVGAGITSNPALIGVFLAFVFGRCEFVELLYGQFRDRLEGCPLERSQHLIDASKEVAYSVAGVLLGLYLNGWLIGQMLLEMPGV